MNKLSMVIVIVFCVIIRSYSSSSIIVDDFNVEIVNSFPSSWKAASKKGSTLYKILEENANRYLNINVTDDSINIAKEIEWDLKQHPLLQWRWRIHKEPLGADPRNESTHDCAAAVYVLIKNGLSPLPKYIKYIWCNSLESGTRFFFKKNRAIVVMRGKDDNLSEWYKETRNVLEDYKYFYGDKKPKIKGISILSDSNNTHSESEADYDDIIISSLK